MNYEMALMDFIWLEGAGRLSSHKGAVIGLITSMLALVIVL